MNAPVTAQQRARRLASQWNARYPPGTEVIVRLGTGELLETTTRTPAYALEGLPVVYLSGRAGCQELNGDIEAKRTVRYFRSNA